MAFLSRRKNSQYWYIRDRIGGRPVSVSTKTDSLQIARAKLREYESRKAGGAASPLPTRTPIAEVVQAYVDHIRVLKTAKSAQTDVYYLREAFGAVCPALEITSRDPARTARRKPRKASPDGRKRERVIEANCFEEITTGQIGDFIVARVRERGLAPKTANRYREILCRLFNWAMRSGRVTLPGDRNPVARVDRYRERASEISYLTLPQIDEQLAALRFKPRLQAMVALLSYSGLRREEAGWLRGEDVDLRRGVIRVRAKTVGGQSWQPKTKTNRAVPISGALREHLERCIAPASDEDWYFPRPKGTRWDPDNFAADLRQANCEAGLSWSCLVYRHTFGSQLAQKGVSLFKISSLMGNSPEICRRHYAHLVPEAMREEVEFARSSDRPAQLVG